MRARRQVCLSCSQDFTRKWNAQRHNKHAHAGEAKILPINYLRYGRVFGEEWTSEDNPILPHASHNRMVDILEEIGTEFEDCDRELQALPQQMRQQILGVLVLAAIISDSPKANMKSSLKTIRRGCLTGRMIMYVAKAMNLHPSTTQEILRSIVESKNYR
jgi:hypothetical protein